MDGLIEWLVEQWSDIVVGLLVAGLVLLVEEIRGSLSRKKALKKQREDIRQDHAQDLAAQLPILMEKWWQTRAPAQPITSKLKAEFVDFAKATSTIITGVVPPAGTLLAGDIVPEDLLGLAGVDYKGK